MTATGSEYVRFDFRTKIILIIAINILLFLSNSFVFECILLIFCLTVISLNGQTKSAVHFLLFFSCMVAIEQLMIPNYYGAASTLVLFIAVAVRKLLPCVIIGKWILTSTEVSEFVATMWKMKLPLDIIIPISVVFRYFPTLKEEWHSLRSAMKMRGIGLSIEHVFVPLLISATTISDELSAAALCRGLDRPGEHTSICNIAFQASDYIAIGFTVIMVIVCIVLKGIGII